MQPVSQVAAALLIAVIPGPDAPHADATYLSPYVDSRSARGRDGATKVNPRWRSQPDRITVRTVSILQNERERLLAAKNRSYDANIRNDLAEVRRSIADMERLIVDSSLAFSRAYHLAWSRWMLSAAERVSGSRDAAVREIESAVNHAEHAVSLRPASADAHAMRVLTLIAVTSLDSTRWRDFAATIAKHRSRALEIDPTNPRVMIMDAGITYYTPKALGGSTTAGLAKWETALERFAAERIHDPLEPNWGGALPYGWLANLYISESPPRLSEAQKHAATALRLRPDFWWLTHNVLPRLREGG